MPIKKLALLLLLLSAPRAFAEGPTPSPGLPPEPATFAEAEASEHHAADMRREADRLRAEAEAIRKRDDAACYAKILVNACRDRVRKENIDRMKVVRQLDIDANQIDRVAKARKVELDMMEKAEPKPTARPLPAEAGPDRKPAAPTADSVPPVPAQLKNAPPARVDPGNQAKADAERAERVRKAEADRKARNEAAAARAAQARQDAERYARHEQEYLEKKKKKAAEAASSAPR